jgi:hypothetical protein
MRSTKGCTIHRLGTVAHLISCMVDMWIKIPGCPSFSISAVKCLITSFQFCRLNAYFMVYLWCISVSLPAVWYVKTNFSVQGHYHFIWRQFFLPISWYSLTRLYKHITMKINMYLYNSWKLKTFSIWKTPLLIITHSASNSMKTVNDLVRRTWKEDVEVFSRSYIGIFLDAMGKTWKIW